MGQARTRAHPKRSPARWWRSAPGTAGAHLPPPGQPGCPRCGAWPGPGRGVAAGRGVGPLRRGTPSLRCPDGSLVVLHVALVPLQAPARRGWGDTPPPLPYWSRHLRPKKKMHKKCPGKMGGGFTQSRETGGSDDTGKLSTAHPPRTTRNFFFQFLNALKMRSFGGKNNPVLFPPWMGVVEGLQLRILQPADSRAEAL